MTFYLVFVVHLYNVCIQIHQSPLLNFLPAKLHPKVSRNIISNSGNVYYRTNQYTLKNMMYKLKIIYKKKK